jgi:hypothetical protein
MMSNSLKSLSGQQWAGPEIQMWKKLDPKGEFESNWNRGSSFIGFVWLEDGQDTTITNPAPDRIQINISPCNPELKEFRLAVVTSYKPLMNKCLLPVSKSYLGGEEVNIYRAK